MNFKVKSMKPLFMATAVAGISALSTVSNADVTYSMIAGGSSALLGGFTAGSYAAGAIPTIIGTSTLSIVGYRETGFNASVDNAYLMNGTILANDGTFTETISAAQVRFLDDTAGNVRVIILLRTDSGQGVRYVANGMRITDLSNATFFKTDGTSVSTISTSAGDLITRLKADAGGSFASSKLPIQTGFSDVAADTIIKYGTGKGAGNYAQPGPTFIPKTGAGSISTSGLASKVTAADLPIQTLLLLYQFSNPTPVNFTRNQVRNILSGAPNSAVDGTVNGPIYWENILPGVAVPATPTKVVAAFRENASGTRNTMFVDVLQGLSENSQGAVIDPKTAMSMAFNNPQNGSGNMINSINRTVNSFGYSFVTGTAGNGKGSISVGGYNGVFPYAVSGGTSTGLSLPNNNSQAAYSLSATSYYTEVVNGKYELWSKAQEISITGSGSQTVAESIASSLNDSGNANLVHSLGFTQTTDMKAVRYSFSSTITGENVTDGQFISYDLGGTQAGGGSIIQ